MIAALAGLRVALVLAGGNALGAYQAGVWEALAERDVEPDWIVGASAGAINGAIIAGNAPEHRLARLAELWRPAPPGGGWPTAWAMMPDAWRRTSEVIGTMLGGRSGLFQPVGSSLTGGSGATPALYDTGPLLRSLPALVDFARLNAGAVRFTATAVDLDSGEDAVFDTRAQALTANHLRASAAMPPIYPAVTIDGRTFVDGGLSANLPLDPVLSDADETPLLCIAVDLLPIAAPRPASLGEMIGRAQDLMFGCQSRRGLARWRDLYAADEVYRRRSVTLARLAYGDQSSEVAGKGMDFSPDSARTRWDAGRRDGRALLDTLERGPEALGKPGLTLLP